MPPDWCGPGRLLPISPDDDHPLASSTPSLKTRWKSHQSLSVVPVCVCVCVWMVARQDGWDGWVSGSGSFSERVAKLYGNDRTPPLPFLRQAREQIGSLCGGGCRGSKIDYYFAEQD